jgi:nicotinamide riboside transporter PnuC
MNPDTVCTSDQWSMITSSASTSQLAGVLGGFLITAIALLFDRNSREGVHTLALFSSAVLILMLDSYLFSLISGTHPPDTGDRQPICAIAWTQGNLATGMLAAGTTALFGGLGWMLASHAVNKAPKEDPADVRAYCFVADLGGWLTFGAAMATTLMMSETSIDYLHFVLGRSPDAWMTGSIVTFCAVAILLDLVVVYIRTRNLNRSLVNTGETTQLALRSIKIATVGTLFLAVAASWLAVSLARFPSGWLTTPNRAFVGFVFVVSLVVPTIISTAICYSVASTNDGLRRNLG